ENVAQAGRGCAASAWDELRKPRNLGPLALPSPPIFIVSGRRKKEQYWPLSPRNLWRLNKLYPCFVVRFIFEENAVCSTFSVLFALRSQQYPIASWRTPRIKMLFTQLFCFQFLRIHHAVNPKLFRNDQNTAAPARLGHSRDLLG